MRLISSLALLALAGCASMGLNPVRFGSPHQTTLPAGTGKTVQLAAGPITLLQAQYMPAQGTGNALLWLSTDPACPPVGPIQSFGKVTKFEGWYGSQEIPAASYLCASSVAETDASLDWVTTQQGDSAPAAVSRPSVAP
ncbi:MAG: hypothetical protein JST54_21965 [Deltaproteobacteria bacterium]|nr:hypothetical protein [Deltaproteobacteria bacterium]